MTELNHTQQHEPFRILVVGDVCVDNYQYGVVDRISPEAPVPVFIPTREESRNGMAANVAANLVALGCAVVVASGQPGSKTRLIDERSKQQIVRIDNDYINQPYPLDGIDLSVCNAVVVSDYNKGNVTYELIENLRKTYTGPIFVDTKKTDLARFAGCIVKINNKEYTDAKTLCDDLIITQGRNGASYKDQTYPAVEIAVTDVCGAGDTFLAALCYEYLVSKDMDCAIEFAIRASAVTVQHIGVYAPTLKEIV
jgi:D-beta-D-heptose 7-phosphate kinase/D-beta-D-heptose 1-phosphate adenosyltransferase